MSLQNDSRVLIFSLFTSNPLKSLKARTNPKIEISWLSDIHPCGIKREEVRARPKWWDNVRGGCDDGQVGPTGGYSVGHEASTKG